MSSPELIEGLDVLDRRALLARIAIIAVIVISAILAVLIALMTWGSYDPNFIIGEGFMLLDLVAVAYGLALFASFIVVGMWIHRAHKNLEAADFPVLEYTPGWSVGWFFVPIANLFKPFQAMRELWNASHGAVGDYSESAPGLFWAWWLCWIFSSIGSTGDDFSSLDIVGLTFTIVSAGALWIIVNTVTQRQHTMDVAEAFT